MRKDNNRVILEPGDTLYRYDIVDTLAKEWDSNYHNPEYSESIYGVKNDIGAVFLFDNKKVAKQTLSAAINRQREKGNVMRRATITTVCVIDDIKLLDLSTDIVSCSNLISRLYDLGMDVTDMDLINYYRSVSFRTIHCDVINLYSADWLKRMKSASNIGKFFNCYCPLLGQTLTDFQNGRIFKNELEKRQFEGYVFWENPSSDTYCIFSSSKLTKPIHEIIDVENDQELQIFIQKDLEGRR